MIATMPSIGLSSAGNRLELGWNFRRSESEVSDSIRLRPAKNAARSYNLTLTRLLLRTRSKTC
jgi:hypothetical protein